MGIFDNFFGPAGSESTVTQRSKYTTKQQALLDMLTNEASTGLRSGGQTYGKDMWAGVNPYEQAWLNTTGVQGQQAAPRPPTDVQPQGGISEGWGRPSDDPYWNQFPQQPGQPAQPGQQVSTGNQAFDAREAAIQRALSGAPAYQVDPQATQNYWNQYLQPQVDKMQRQLNEQYAPGIFSGGRDIAQGEFSTGVLGQYANLAYQDEQSRRQALTDAANRSANVAPTAWGQQTANMQNAGSLARSIDEKRLTTDYQRWMAGEPDPTTGEVNQFTNPYRALALQLLGLSPNVYGTETNAHGAGMGYGAAAGAASGIGSAIGTAIPGIVGGAWDTIKGTDWWKDLTGVSGPEYTGDYGGDYGGSWWDPGIDYGYM